MTLIDWTTFAITMVPMGITAIAGGAAMRVRTQQHAKDLTEVKDTLHEHIKEDNAVHGNVREMSADIRWIREALERMESR